MSWVRRWTSARSARRVRRLRRWIAENRCAVRPGLTHAWEDIWEVWDSSQLAPPVEYAGAWCTKCGHEERD